MYQNVDDSMLVYYFYMMYSIHIREHIFFVRQGVSPRYLLPDLDGLHRAGRRSPRRLLLRLQPIDHFGHSVCAHGHYSGP